jgi:phytoene synthase
VTPEVASFVGEDRQRVAAAYEVCREIARREAKNFYYAFRALPTPKRNAICAVYAFMRHADDLSDDESLPHAERRRALDAWISAWHDAERGQPTGDPVFVALADAQRRFRIPSELLDQLVQGTAMDLDRPVPQSGNAAQGKTQGNTALQTVLFDVYPTFDDLYRYCYLVASVVGLVCIRIFGYEDARAEKLAEETGIAFQLTNILRDVREDADRGRIYLPLDDMEQLGVTTEELMQPRAWSQSKGLKQLLELEAGRAERYYESGRKLLPLISPDSRAAMWVLVTIYHRLLQHIERRGYDVFSSRVSVPKREKLWILARGLLRGFAYRLSGA